MSKFATRRFIAAGFVGLSAFALAACGGAPSESDIKDRFLEGFTASGVISGADAETAAACMAKELTANMSEDGLSMLMDSTDVNAASGLSTEDQKAFTDASTKCLASAMGGS